MSKSLASLSKSHRLASSKARRTICCVLGLDAMALLLFGAPFIHPPLLRPLLNAGISSQALGKVPGYDNLVLAAQTPQITVQALEQLLETQPVPVVLIDVRTAEEVAIAKIPGSVHIPVELIENGWAIPEIQTLLAEAKTEQSPAQLILHCYSGPRSHHALAALREAGIEGANLKGGIKAWQRQIDPSLPEKLL